MESGQLSVLGAHLTVSTEIVFHSSPRVNKEVVMRRVVGAAIVVVNRHRTRVIRKKEIVLDLVVLLDAVAGELLVLWRRRVVVLVDVRTVDLSIP